MSNRKRIRRSTVQRLVNAAQDLDADFFEQHPNIQRYVRPATPDELQALSYPPGTMVHVQLLSHNRRARAFVLPATTRSN
ncbi:MAG: hypothetical protein M3Q08_18740 [Pseudomonadota bacterium]|nr:hypothetical protein [Pseudomonadota bacterium]